MQLDYKLPIIFIHTGDSDYLYYSLKESIALNPDAEIILIGDKENEHYKKDLGIIHYDIKNYFDSAEKIESVYIHMSTHPYWFELFCIQRWAILFDFAHKHNLTFLCYQDSDNVATSNYTEYLSQLENIDFDFIGDCRDNPPESTGNPSIQFISYNFLQQLNDYLYNSFTNNDYLNPTQLFWSAYQENGGPGGVSDMYYLSEFLIKNRKNIQYHDIYDHSNNKCIAEENINIPSNPAKNFIFQMASNNMKEIIIEKSKVYGFSQSNIQVQFLSLHFQGFAKKYIKCFSKLKYLDKKFSWDVVELYLNTIEKYHHKVEECHSMIREKDYEIFKIKNEFWYQFSHMNKIGKVASLGNRILKKIIRKH